MPPLEPRWHTSVTYAEGMADVRKSAAVDPVTALAEHLSHFRENFPGKPMLRTLLIAANAPELEIEGVAG